MACSEDDLVHIEDMRRGGQKGFMILYQRYEKRLRAYLMSKTYYDASKCDADTVVNDTFYAFYKSIHTFRGECSVYTWLSRIAEKRYLSCARQKKHVTRRQASDKEGSESQTYEKEKIRHYEIEREVCISQCMDRLIQQLCEGKSYTECLKALTFVSLGLTYEEIAEKTGRPSANACKQFVHSCKKKISDQHPLKRCLKDCSSD